MIDKIPAVGRFLFKESILRDGFFQRAGFITRINGTRVYFTTESALPSERYISIKMIAAVC